MRKAIALLPLVALACGPVNAGSDLGDPIYTFDVVLEGDPLPEAEGEYRVVFGWVSYGGGPWPECVRDSPSTLDCGFFPPPDMYESLFTIFDVRAEPKFPDGLSVPFYEFPSDDMMLEFEGSVFALGGMALYDDRNGNGELDPFDPMDAQPIDRLIAETVVTNLKTAAVFKEGRGVHPIKKWIDEYLNCDRAPFGYSVGTAVPGNCQVDEDIPLVMTKSDPMEIGQARCGGAIAALQLSTLPRKPPAQLPSNAVIRCGLNNAIFVSLDNGNYCDRYREIRYTLQSGPLIPAEQAWDVIDDPPDYWPCMIRRGGG